MKRWYSSFGVDHLFTDANSIITNNSVKNKKLQDISGNDVRFETLEDLKNFVMANDICGLKKLVRNTVFADGAPSSDIMIIGEAPGEMEDIEGKPFVGQSGQLLDNMLRSVGFSRLETYITNIVFWRPPGNRTPSNEEIALCMPYVREHIRLVQPKILLLLGGVAVRSILGTNEPISKIRGRKSEFCGIRVIPTFHPAYLLRSPGQKAISFLDMLSLNGHD